MQKTERNSQKTWRNSFSQWCSIIGLSLMYLIAYSIGLQRNKFGNPFYAAAVQAGAHSWKAFFYGASDFNSTITVDKPPLSLWPASLAVRFFGLNSWSLLWPQVIIGLFTSWIIYIMVRRYASHLMAWISVFAFMTCPLVFIMFRFNNPDAMMLFLVTLSVYTLVRGIEVLHGGNSRLYAWQWNVLTGIIMGLSFLTKQLEGLMTIPALAIGIVTCVPTWKLKISSLMYNLIGLLLGAGWWTAIVELVSKDQRPYIGGSPTNDFIQLTLYYNGIGRFSGSSFHRFAAISKTYDLPSMHDFNFSLSSPSLTRFLWSFEATQIGLLSSLSFIGVVLGYFWLYRWYQGTPVFRSLYVIISVWFISLWLVFSFMGRVFHPYYPLIIATPCAVLSGFALAILWKERNQWWSKKILVLIIVLETCTAVITSYNGDDLTPNYIGWIFGIVGIVTFIITLIMITKTAYAYTLKSTNIWMVSTWIGILFITFVPSLYYLGTSYSRSIGTGLPTAGPGFKEGRMSFAHRFNPKDIALMHKVERYILQDANKYTWEAGSIGLDTSDFQLETGHSVMPVGGFAGLDPCPTLEQFKNIVQSHQMHYFILHADNHAKDKNTQERSQVTSTETIATTPTISTASHGEKPETSKDKKSTKYADMPRMQIVQPEIYSYITENFPFKEFSNENTIFKIYDLTKPLPRAKQYIQHK